MNKDEILLFTFLHIKLSKFLNVPFVDNYRCNIKLLKIWHTGDTVICASMKPLLESMVLTWQHFLTFLWRNLLTLFRPPLCDSRWACFHRAITTSHTHRLCTHRLCTHKLCAISSHPYHQWWNKFTSVKLPEQADWPVRGKMSASELLIVWPSFPGFTHIHHKLLVSACIRHTLHVANSLTLNLVTFVLKLKKKEYSFDLCKALCFSSSLSHRVDTLIKQQVNYIQRPERGKKAKEVNDVYSAWHILFWRQFDRNIPNNF